MQCNCGGSVRESASARVDGTRVETRWCPACERTERRLSHGPVDTGWHAPAEVEAIFVAQTP